MENGSNNLIGLMMDQNPNQLIGLLGILESGNGFVPLDPDFPLDRIDFMIRDSSIDILVTEARHLDKALQLSGCDNPVKHIICLDNTGNQVSGPERVRVYDLSDLQRAPETHQKKINAGSGRIAYLVYTSGSTGKPKGVPITHENLFPLLQWSKQYFKYGENTRTLQSLSFCFDFGIFEVMTTVLLGGTLYFIEKNRRLDPPRYAESVNHHAINTIHSTPSFFNELACSGCELKTLRALHLGGEALISCSVDQMFDVVGENCAINNWYGPSETTVNSSVFEVGTRHASRGTESVTIPIGKASAKNELYVLDRHCNLVAEGVAGELYIGGPGLAPAYLNRPDLTAEKFVPCPFDMQSGTRIYKTGDLVRRLSDGSIEFLGRLDHQVKVRGFRIELGEIEAALAEHESVQEVVVLALEDRPGSKRLVAYIVPDHEPAPASSEIRGFLRQQLPDYMIPSAFVMLKSMPLTPNGKLDRRSLPQPESARPALAGDFAAPRSPSEEVIAGICAEVLGLERIGINDNFFDLGCHSLLATKIVLRLREVFEVELPLVRLFEYPTVAGLIRALAMEDQADERLAVPPIQPAPRDVDFPLSFAQERVWFLGELDPGSVSYHVPRALRIEGPFSVCALQQSFGEIIRRHEILRTTFPKIAGRPRQVIHQPGPIQLRLHDLRDLTPPERERQIHQHVLAEGRRPFDMKSGPFLRLSVLQLDDREHVFILAEHHLVHDGWTQGVLIRDFLALYRSMSEGMPSPLPELTIQYADFAYWQRQWLQGETLEKQLTYWKQELADAPPILNLPTDRPRPAIQRFRGAEYTLVLRPELAEPLRAMSRREGVTLFMTMLAAFKTLLYRYTGQGDMIVGAWVANRRALEIETLLGMIINTIVLRTDLSAKPSFSELLKRVREVCMGAYAHQDLPFERLVEELRPDRSLSHNPIFQVLFAFQDTATPALELPGMRMEVIEAHNESAKFDLNVVVLPHREQLVGQGVVDVTEEITVLIEYSTDLFDRDTVERMAEHYEILLESAVKAGSRSIAEMDMLTEKERRLLIGEWNATAAEYPSEKCVPELFEEQVERTPEAVAVVFEEEQLSYGELNRRANRLARYLVKLGVSPEVRIALCVERGPEMVIGLLGVLKSGGAYVPMDPGYPEDRLAYMLEDSHAQIVLTQRRVVERLPESVPALVRLDGDWERVAREGAFNLEAAASQDNLAYVIYTSGSTGRPKGVGIERRGLANFVTAMSRQVGPSSGDVLLAVTSLSFDISMLEIFLPLVTGARVVVAGNEAVGDGYCLIRQLTDSGVTHMQGTPATWRLLMEAGWTGGTSLSVLCGGEALPGELADELIERGPRIWNLYGPTETTIWSTMWPVESNGGAVSIGRPIANTQVYLLDEKYQPSPVGVAGELYIGGAGLARGYVNRPDFTGERFIPNLFGEAGSRLYRAGDVARYRRDGNIDYVGRTDHQVKVRGYRIELGEIESVLAGHAGVRQCAVCVREDDRGDKRLVAYIVPSSEIAPAGAELRKYLQRRLPEYMAPWPFVELSELPLTANGKLDRKALPAPAEAEIEMSEEPRTPLEEIVAGIWARELRVQEVGLHQNFFELGGHSLLATQLIARVRDILGVDVSLRLLFETPTVQALAAAVDRELCAGRSVESSPIRPVNRDSGLPLSFAQQRLWFIDQFEPESAAYNISMTVRIGGDLDISALTQSLQEIVRRHEVLRTRFEVSNGQPVQVIAECAEIDVALWDIADLADGEHRQWTRRLAEEEAGLRFDLTRGPLVRVKVLRLDDNEHEMLITMHHIVSDGWSVGVMAEEFVQFYGAFRAGRPSPLSELPIQYADFSVWQREWLQEEVLEEQLLYWREQLSGIALLELPTDRLVSPAASRRGNREHLTLPPKLTDELKELSRREGVTLFMTLLAGFQLLLARYTGQEDIAVGTPIAGRNRAETEGIIGLFVNTLVMRTDFGRSPTVRELLGRVRETALGAYAHQDLPFEKLVEELGPERSLSHDPLFQVMFAFQNVPRKPLGISGLSVSAEPNDADTAKFHLALVFEEEDGVIHGSLTYALDQYDRDRVLRMLGHLSRLLEGMVVDQEQSTISIPLLTAEERQQVVIEWSRTEAPYRKVNKRLHDLFEKQVDRAPDAMAVIAEDASVTYNELNERANRLAHYLRSKGVGPESAVGICMERSIELMVAMLGVLKAGGAYVPLDPSYPRNRLAFMIEDTQTPMVLTQLQLVELVPVAQPEVFCLDSEWETISRYSGVNMQTLAADQNLAYVIYTSGSTGRPKGVQITHHSLTNLVSWHQHAFQVNKADRASQFAAMSFDASVWEIWPYLAFGASIHMVDEETRGEPELLRDWLVTRGITVTFLPTPLAERILSLEWATDTSVRTLLTGGDKLHHYPPPSLAFEVVNNYGPTENTVVATSATLPAQESGATPHIGRPITNAEVYVLDEVLEPVAVGIPGELYLGGAGLARAYLNLPELTAESFVPSCFGSALGGRLYRTGDRVKRLPGGNIEFIGRIDHQVKIRGHRIELEEIESALAQHDDVRQCAACVWKDRRGENRLIAYVVGSGTEALDRAELRRYLLGILPEYMVPWAFIELSTLPMTASGKLDRKALPSPGEDETTGQCELARTPLEDLVAGIWAEVLGLEKVGVNQNFFELGGHSLSATQAISRVRDVLRVEAPLRLLFQNPTVAALTEAVERERGAGRLAEAPPIRPVNRDRDLPLSFAQQRLWFIQQLEPESAAYNVAGAVRLSGPIDVKVLKRSLREIAGRHEVLRTRFEARDGRPVQVIDEPSEIELPVCDLIDFPEGDREQRIRELARREAVRPFDLERGPLWRASLLRLSALDYVLLVNMHLLVSDGWSTGVLVKELTVFYEALAESKPLPLPELEIQYADYAVWQREWLQGEALATQLEYWKSGLAGVEVLDLPTDRPRPNVASYKGSRVPVKLTSDLTERLKLLSNREGVTLFMTLLAAFDMLLYRYSGQEDLCVGTPIASRNRKEIEGLIGFFVNTLVLRNNVAGHGSFDELLKAVREVTLAAFDHQDVPFEKLVEELRPERSLNHSALFQAMFVLQSSVIAAVEFGAVKLSRFEVDTRTAKFDVVLELFEEEGTLNGWLRYNTDLFEAATIERMAGHYRTLLKSVEARPRRRVSEMPMLGEHELEQILIDWNQTRIGENDTGILSELFEDQARRRPEGIAIECGDHKVTYRELNERANQLAHYLGRQGVRVEHLVGICIERSIEMVVGVLGVLKSGGAYVPLDPTHPRLRLSHIVDDAGISLLLTRRGLARGRLHNGSPVICVDEHQELICRESIDNPAGGAAKDNLAYVIYTSGSTGKPKGVMITHRAVCNHLRWRQRAYPLAETDRFLHKASLGFDISVWEIFSPLLAGAQLVIADSSEDIARSIAERNINFIHFSASLFQALLKERALAGCGDLKHVFSGGEPMSAELEDLFLETSSAKLHNQYGPTETTIDVLIWDCDGDTKRRTVPIGRPIDNAQAYVLDSDLQPAPVGVIGELHIGGLPLARGYLNRADLTAEKFVPGPFSRKPGERLYKTGDLARYCEGGEIEYLERIDRQVKVRGFRVELGEVETVLSRHPDIKNAVVKAHSRSPLDNRLIAYVVGRNLGMDDLNDYLRKELPEFMLPVAYVWLESLPVTSTGKLDRRALPDPDDSLRNQREYVAPRDPVEELLAGIWSKLLGVDRVGIHDDFFELGGHSLLITRVASQIRGTFSVDVPLRVLFDATTIGQLAVVIAAEQVRVADENEVARMLKEIRQLSPSEIRSILDAENRGVFARQDV